MPNFYVEIDKCDGSPKEKIGPFVDDRSAAFTEARKRLSPDVVVELKADTVMCDFCSQPNPRWVYPAKDFGEIVTKFASVGDWGACEECKQLIQAGDWDTLAQRSMTFIGDKSLPEDINATVLQAVKDMHQGFAQSRIGGPYPVEERISDDELEENNG